MFFKDAVNYELLCWFREMGVLWIYVTLVCNCYLRLVQKIKRKGLSPACYVNLLLPINLYALNRFVGRQSLYILVACQ